MTLPAPTSDEVRWRYHFTDFRSGRLLATLPLLDVDLGEVLSGAADCSGVVPLSSAAVLSRDPIGATIPRRGCMWAERQTIDSRTGQVNTAEVLGAALVMDTEETLAGRALKLSMVGWGSYFQQRLLPTVTHTQVDKFTIMRTLFRDAVQQPATAGYPTVSPHHTPLDTTAGNLSGVLADRTYLATDLKPVLEAAKELSSSGAGFDWRLVPYMDTPGDLNTFRVRLDLGYPRLGRVQPADVRWSNDPEDSLTRWGFLMDGTVTVRGSVVKNRITAIGAGTGPDQLRATFDGAAVGRDEVTAGYALFEGAASGTSSEDRTQDTVDGKALGTLYAGFASEIAITGLKVRGDLAPTLPSYAVGDDITVRAVTASGQRRTFIGQLIARTIKPAGQGSTETVALDMQGTVG